AFAHDEIANMALDTLRAQLDSQHMAFEMLPEKYTLRELQRLHEVVWNRKLDKRNFRKNVKRMDHVVGLNEKEQGVLHKPAQLFTYDSESSVQVQSSKASS
ncbi:MAG: NUDIX hydrolase, partial [Flavobacteriales bacterium]|nr:NUDIX hydrolase [Flavobacteriales bacterium]